MEYSPLLKDKGKGGSSTINNIEEEDDDAQEYQDALFKEKERERAEYERDREVHKQSIVVRFPEEQPKLCNSLGLRRTFCITCIICWTCIFLAAIITLIAAYFIIGDDEPIRVSPIEESINVPDAPDPPILLEQNFESVLIAWNEPDNHQSVILYYEVEYRNETGDFEIHLPGPGAWLQYEVRRLKAGENYYFRVRAINGIGAGNFSLPSGYSTLNATSPSPPFPARVVETTTTSIFLNWAPGPGNGATVTGYEIRAQINGTEYWQTVYEGPDPIANVTSLEVFEYYNFRVRTLSLQGPSNWSFVVSYHTDSQFAATPLPPFPLALQSSTCDSLIVTWTRPGDRGSEIIYYNGTAILGNNSFKMDALAFRNPVAEEEILVFANLLPESRYRILNIAINSIGSSLSGLAILYSTLPPSAPNMPQPPRAIEVYPNSITITWLEPATNCAPVLFYEVEADDWWKDESMIMRYQGIDTLFTYDNLVPAVTYNFKLFAHSSYGESGKTPIVSVTTFNNGACGNQQDVDIVKTNFEEMQGIIQSCIIRCAIGGTECALECVMEDLGLSEQCSLCWVNTGYCILNECALECIRPSSEGCIECTEEKCYPDAELCTGMPSYTFPL